MDKVLSGEDIDSSIIKGIENEKEIEILPEPNLFKIQIPV